MRIFVEPSDYTLLNVGDMAMLEIAYRRMKSLWPVASIQILTDDPKQLQHYCHDAIPIPTSYRHQLFAEGYIFGPLFRLLPPPARKPWCEIEQYIRRRFPEIAQRILFAKMRLRGKDTSDIRAYLDTVTTADLLVVSGMGGITDAFHDYAVELLDTVDMAIKHNIPTALFGQGIGPLHDTTLRKRAAEVLPYVHLIALREGRTGIPLLKSLGVPPERIMVTGDDAIELAYQMRSDIVEDTIGVNLRLSTYASVNEKLADQVGRVIRLAAKELDTRLLPVPISYYPVDADAAVISTHLLGDGAEQHEPFNTPAKIIRQIQRCRIVVTGSYHAAVFAMAQGIPAIGLYRSAYYEDKFYGLNEQFGTLGKVVNLNDDRWQQHLAYAIRDLWHNAACLKPQLLELARVQIEASRRAYRHLYDLVKIQP